MRGGGQVLRFSRLLVKNWRSFLRSYVELRPRTFLVGPTASGKSNFLDVFCFLRDVAAPAGGFQEAVRRRGGVPRLRCLAARQDSDLGLLAHAGCDDGPAEWEYELHFNQEGSASPRIKRERLSRGGEEVFLRPDEADQADPERLTLSYLERGSLNRKVRDFAAFLATVRYLNLVPQVMRESDRSGGERFGPAGAGILEEIAATNEKSRNSRLRLILQELQAALPRLRQLESLRDAHGRPHLRALFEHWRPHGAWQSEDQFSDGTLRLVGILWTALEASGPLLVEEPELSLHEQIVRLVPRMLARLGRRTGRQVIVTTHSLDLLCGAGVTNEEILLLCPGEQGTLVRPARALGDAADLLRGEMPQGESSALADGRQLGLFGEGSAPEADSSKQ
jgi:predicted ATPase